MSEMKLPRLPRSNYPNITYQRRYIGTVYTPEQMKAYAMRAVLAEREACAKAVESIHLFGVGQMREFEKATLEDAAFKIRHRDKE